MREKAVTVFGSGRVAQGSTEYAEARWLGQLLAEAGFTVINGGYGGTMEAVSWGAREAGGRVVGVTMELFARQGIRANRWLSEEIMVPTFFPRLEKLIDMADGLIALRGGVGTLTEVSLAWSLLQTGAMRKPFVLVGERWQRVMAALSAEMLFGERDMALVRMVWTVEEGANFISQHSDHSRLAVT